MRTVPKRRLLAGVVLAWLPVVAMAFAPAAAGGAETFPHAYYLFLAGAPQGCEDCYVPLLVTRQTLEEVASAGGDSATILITTYERDSSGRSNRVSRSLPPTSRRPIALFVFGAGGIGGRRSLPRRSFDCWRSRRARFQFAGSCRYPTGKCGGSIAAFRGRS